MKARHSFQILLLGYMAMLTAYVALGEGHKGRVPEVTEIAREPEYEYLSPHVTLSHYDDFFREAADSIELDWLLIAAIAYTESRFDSTAVSTVGARGVMQMMPRTLQGLEVPDSLHADNRHNIMASARYLKSLFYMFRRVKNYDERINFVLASYNAGYGHIMDAMRLARKHGHDRHKWNASVDSFLIKKSIPEYYNDSICRNGEFKDWKQTLSFVSKVKRHWKRFYNMQQEYSDSINAVMAADTLKRIR
ncbi:MAG: transglycosylase SLT domain-containing protein [Bacteroidaceae bacterium]|nr:transglycosylase SLT domain-containing protein [Bacteroidaceae bacterium]